MQITDVWVIVETDRNVPILGPNGSSKAPVATYCWTFVNPSLQPGDGFCVGYTNSSEVPPLG